MGELIQEVMSRCGMECLFADEQYLQAGFYAGFAIGLLVVLFGFLFILEMRRRRRASGILLQGAAGDLFITTNAVHEFIGNVMEEYPDVRVLRAWIRRRSSSYTLKISVILPFNVEVPTLKNQIEQHLIHCMKAKLGVEKPVRINISVRQFMGEAQTDSTPKGTSGSSDGQRNPLTGFPGILGAEEHDF